MGHILLLGMFRNDAQIRSSIIKPNPVDVIYFPTVSDDESKQLAMQQKGLRPAINVLATSSISTPVKTPRPLGHETGIGGINECVGSDATVFGAERDAHGGIIKAHRTLHRSGVTPPVVCSNAGVSHVNYSSWGTE